MKSDSAVYIQDGDITISSADDGIKSEISIEINGGTLLINNSVEGLEAPYITINDGDVHIFPPMTASIPPLEQAASGTTGAS